MQVSLTTLGKGEIAMGTDYKCSECANQRTPLCDSCNQIKKPSGEKTKPTRYVKLGEMQKRFGSGEELNMQLGIRTAIKFAIYERQAIPLNAVIEYNNFVEKYRDPDS